MYTQYIQRFPVGPQIQDARVNLNAIAPQVLRSLDAKPEVPNAAPEPAADPNAADPNAAEPAADPNAAQIQTQQNQQQIKKMLRKIKTQKRSLFLLYFFVKEKIKGKGI